MPLALLEPRNRSVRHEWFAHYGLSTFRDQHAALERARRHHGIEQPDPRNLLRGITNSTTPLRPRRRRA